MRYGKSAAVAAMIALPIASFALFGFSQAPHQPMLNGKTVNLKPISHDQMTKVMLSVKVMQYPNALYERSGHPGNFPSSEVSTDRFAPLTNHNIQELNLPNGIFIKTTASELKAQQLRDPNWVKDHTFSTVAPSRNTPK